MNIKKFFAENTQEAMKMVKKEMGAEAVIIRTKTISNPDRAYGRGKKGIEVTAAVDYDIVEEKPVNASPDQSSLQRLERELKEIKDSLMMADAGAFLKPECLFNRDLKERYSNFRNFGLNNDVIMNLMNEVHDDAPFREEKTHSEILKDSLLKVLNKISIDAGDRGSKGRKIYSFIGPTGVGKTTTLAKLAAANAVQGGRKTALITLDTYRIAATAQLQTYARIMDLPLEVAVNRNELKEAIRRHSDCDRIFIDTAGRSPNRDSDLTELKRLLSIDEEIHPFLVLSATTQYQNMINAEKRFGALSFKSFIFTKLDECGDLSTMINFLLSREKPVSYFTAGQNVPEDIEIASKKKLATFLLAGMRGTQNISISEEKNDRSSCRS
jgi:flagellar biosynthesis protein FlhF